MKAAIAAHCSIDKQRDAIEKNSKASHVLRLQCMREVVSTACSRSTAERCEGPNHER